MHEASRRAGAVLGLLVFLAPALPDAPSPKGEGTPVTYRAALAAFQSVNRNIAQVRLLEMRAWSPPEGGGRPERLVGLFWACSASCVFQGDFTEELFGLFMLQEAPRSPLKMIAIFPTQRWRDYKVWIAEVTGEAVSVRGEGATYGDAKWTARFGY